MSLQTFIGFASLAIAVAVVTPPLSTNGNQIVDSTGKNVRLACVNWYGAHMERYVVNGLDARPLEDIAASIADMGFNCVRLVFSNDLFAKNPILKADAVSANPKFAGQPAMQAFDAVVAALTRNGVMVILNNHISDAGWCCSESDGNGLWYTKSYPTDVWQEMWVKLAQRYQDNALVVGADLRNELRGANGVQPTWGDNNMATDWKTAAERCGNAVLQQNSKILILVEGLKYANNLRRLSPVNSSDSELCYKEQGGCHVQEHPVKLSKPKKLAYSGHIYSWDNFESSSYDAYEKDMKMWQTYVTTPGQDFTAPFWMGEFGTNSASTYWKQTIELLKKHPEFSWAYWAVDGYKHSAAGGSADGETYGIFMEDYKTIRHPWKLADLQSVQVGAELAVASSAVRII